MSGCLPRRCGSGSGDEATKMRRLGQRTGVVSLSRRFSATGCRFWPVEEPFTAATAGAQAPKGRPYRPKCSSMSAVILSKSYCGCQPQSWRAAVSSMLAGQELAMAWRWSGA